MKPGRQSRAVQTHTAMATVTSCHYEFGAGQALAFGIPKSRHFQITFNYWAGGSLHTGEFASSKAVPQGTLFPITYNPEAPHENSKSDSVGTPTRPLLGFVVAAVVVVAAVSMFAMHGCTPIR